MSFFLDSVLEQFSISVISTNHWLVCVATTSMDQLGIGMLFTPNYLPLVIVIFTILLLLVCVVILGFFFSQLKKMRASWDLDSQKTQEFECEVTNLPFFLLFIWIGATFASACSFVLGYNILENVLENQIPFENLVEGQNQIPFETLTPEVILNQTREHVFMDNVTVIEGILKNNQKIISAQNENRIYDIEGLLYRGYDEFFDGGMYRSYLDQVAHKARTEDFKGYDNLEMYKTKVSARFQEKCVNIYKDKMGFFGVIDGWSKLLENYITSMEKSFEGYYDDYAALETMSEIVEQKLKIIQDYAETTLEGFQQQRFASTLSAYESMSVHVPGNNPNAVSQTIRRVNLEFRELFFHTYQTSVEVEAFFDNLMVIHGQEAAALETPFAEYQESGKPIIVDVQILMRKLVVPRVIDEKIWCDGVYYAKE